MSLIKICGLKRQEDIDAVNEGLPDFIGFVFAESRRRVVPDEAKALRAGLDPSIKVSGVFVNESSEKVADICGAGTIDIVQLHGDEDETYVARLKRLIRNPIIRAVRVKSEEDLRGADNLSCDYLLLDAWDKSQYGGLGKTFDWSLIGNIKKPFFLAGGLNPENISLAARTVRPYCLDISSGVETGGFKDRDKILKTIKLVRSVT